MRTTSPGEAAKSSCYFIWKLPIVGVWVRWLARLRHSQAVCGVQKLERVIGLWLPRRAHRPDAKQRGSEGNEPEWREHRYVGHRWGR